MVLKQYYLGTILSLLFWKTNKKLHHSLGRPSRSDFVQLEFAGENTTEQQRINGRIAVINRSYNLYSDVQRADDVVVTLPAKAGEKHFSPEQKVKLINPRITTDGYKIGERGFVNYILLADDMLPVENK